MPKCQPWNKADICHLYTNLTQTDSLHAPPEDLLTIFFAQHGVALVEISSCVTARHIIKKKTKKKKKQKKNKNKKTTTTTTKNIKYIDVNGKHEYCLEWSICGAVYWICNCPKILVYNDKCYKQQSVWVELQYSVSFNGLVACGTLSLY